MTLEQTILFTVMPRGISINADVLPVSVFVAPRLSGADNLGAFLDWLGWTRHLKDSGLELEFQCGPRTFTAPINRQPLRPDLWEQLFKEDTLVRSHTFDDYSDRGIISYPVRQALSALKAIYQEASVDLALPVSPSRGQKSDEQTPNRKRLGQLVSGLEVHWNGEGARLWREEVVRNSVLPQQPLGPLDREGLIVAKPDDLKSNNLAVQFAVFHHMPTPQYKEPPIDEVLDKDNLLDFHQALSALNSYPDLLRALGIVFDFDLPRDFVSETPLGQSNTISVSKVTAGWEWAAAPKTPSLATAYVHMLLGAQRFFFTAPRVITDHNAPVAPLLEYENTYNHKAPITVIGLLNLDPKRFGLAQVDVDGGMHKAIMLAETMIPPVGHNLDSNAVPEEAPNPEVFDPDATLPALRSGGFSLFADGRALQLLDTMMQSKAFNDAVQSGGTQLQPFFAEDLIRGYRLDVWDSSTNNWHSLHLCSGEYKIGDLSFTPETKPEEGFVQLAVMQPARGSEPATNDLYLHEAIARWAGWSLSAPMPAKHLSRYPNAADAVPSDDKPDMFAENQPDTPFKLTTKFTVAPNSLPRLHFGTRYRFRARAVDLAGNGLKVDDKLADMLAKEYALPLDPEGFTYLRFEPVAAPLVILRDPGAVTDPGSAVDRLVIRTFNDDISKDTIAVDTAAADRHIVPPRTSVEMSERLGMFDDATGKLKSDAATWQLIMQRDAGEFNKATIEVAGKTNEYPLESSNRIDALPHLPDPISRGAAIRDLPGTPSGAIGKVVPDSGAANKVSYELLSDPNPRPGSATLISFGTTNDWQKTVGFRLTLAEPQTNQQDLRPDWDPTERQLTIYLSKGQTKVVPLTSYMAVDDLKLMGVWQWLREHIEWITVNEPQPQYLQPGTDVDRIAHVLQRAVEGGHWMLTPPRLLTLVHAVQQPMGRPEFIALNVEHDVANEYDPNPLQTAPDRGRTDPTELASVTAWRRPGATDAYLHGALKVHAASTAKLDLLATWEDPEEDPSQPTWAITQRAASVDELPLHTLDETYLYAAGKDKRAVGYYDPEHDQIAFVRAGDWAGTKDQNYLPFFNDAVPQHLFNDTKRHIVSYTAIATSRFREYFPPDATGGFTRSSEPIVVDVPASARPLAPDVAYVIPTFGWQRQTDTNLKRSVRFGGGLRVYLNRPWFSSGKGELLGVALWSSANGSLDATNRDKFKPFFTQWGMDPIWQTDDLSYAPSVDNFPDIADSDWDQNVSLEESSVYSFSWDNIPGNNNGRLIDFLNQSYNIGWVKWENIIKSADGNTISAFDGNNSISLSLNNDKTKVSLKNNGSRIDELIAKIENSKLNIYQPGRINVVGFKPEFDESRGLWYADFTINTFTKTYMPFVRLALVRYQPHALANAKVSRVVLADFAQLTPDRYAMVTADPYHPRSLKVVVSGIAPRGPQAVVRSEPPPSEISPKPTQIQVLVQQRDPVIQSDLAWHDVSLDVAQVEADHETHPDLVLWVGTVTFARPPHPGEFRLLITEREFISADYVELLRSGGEALPPVFAAPSRIVYSEIFPLDSTLIAPHELGDGEGAGTSAPQMAILQCAINWANNSGKALFFRGDHFIIFDWNRPTTDKTGAVFKGRAVEGPFRIDSTWNLPLTMQLSGFASSFDAGLSGDAGGSPTYDNKMYFFKGTEYVRYDYLEPPIRIPDLKGAVSAWNLPANFGNDVRGAFNGKRSRLGYAYFFKGPSYVRYRWSDNTVDADYPKPISGLIDMPHLFWSGIDAALDGDGDFADFGYLFRDDFYCRFNWVDVRVDNGPHMVWNNWPGVLELLLAAEAKVVALAWVADDQSCAVNQLKFYIASLKTGIPSPFDTALMEAALQKHFHVSPSMSSPTRMALLAQIEKTLEEIEGALGQLDQIVQFHDDGEVKDLHATSKNADGSLIFVGADGSPNFRAYTSFDDHIYLTSRYFRMCDTPFTAAAVLIHEAVHYLDKKADWVHDSPEWYVTGTPRLRAKVLQNGVEVEVDVEYYDQLTPEDAVHNPSSYNAFIQHVYFGNDRRLGQEVLRPGY